MEAIKVKLVPLVLKGLGFSFSRNFHLKATFTSFIFLAATQLFAQSKSESEILAISKNIFRWEVEGKLDSLANLLNDKLVVIGSKGTKRGKNEYLTDLKNGKPVHNNIDVQEASATIQGKTAIVNGKGLFETTTNGILTTSHLSYLEVFIKEKKYWKLIAINASRLPD